MEEENNLASKANDAEMIKNLVAKTLVKVLSKSEQKEIKADSGTV